MNGRSKGRNTHVDTSLQPIEIDSGKGTKGLGVLLIIFSLIFGGIPTFILVSSIFNGTFKPEMLPILLFTFIGTGMFFGGLASLFYKKRVAINDNRVKISIKSIFGDKEFNEHLNNYKGIRNYSEYHSGGKNSPSYTLYINQLLHMSDKKLNIKLDVQRNSENGMRVLWETHCRNLNLPGLTGELGAEIETISVARSENNNGGMGLMLKSDFKSLHIAQGQKKESLEWLKNCILSSIAR